MPSIDPQPARADLRLPWDEPVADPVAVIAAARAELGDTFSVDSGNDRYLFLFSPLGVRSFYGLAEEQASKGVADWRMLRRKLPEELFDGRRTAVGSLFGRANTATYLAQLDDALDVEVEQMGADGTVDVFAFTRRLGHRLGLASWAGRASAIGKRFDRLVAALDALDASDSFVRPADMAEVARQGKHHERAALAAAELALGDTIDERLADGPQDDLLDRIIEAWQDAPPENLRRGVARDVVLVHLASMSNMFAALGWAVVDLMGRPDLATEIASGDATLAERCMLESTRMAQRSIMLRYVLASVEVTDEHHTYQVSRGVTVATLLPLTNTSAAPGLDRFDPSRWTGRRLSDAALLPAVELVTTFGHGSHTCPAQSFSLSAAVRTLTRLFSTFALTAHFTDARPLPGQIGGVARAADPCPIAYHRVA